ncbi:hypothetical protein V3C99_009486 [Haemonchus contortus]|uniref:G_PROTEIN_RECEP_F1_2 domain-containing protein n=1 Tax=Haemonchus contortus TaxID=6289 RepID=A0A7I4YK76_HAECO|nr:7TM GPCR domain containing protein [Haemonchus contortus]
MVLGAPQWIFIVVNIVSLPLYLLLIIICIKEVQHKSPQSTFYIISISQGVMDIMVMVDEFFFAILRFSDLLNEFYWKNHEQYYFATWCFNHTYISMCMRVFGVLLISFQRYISLCRSGHTIEQVINTSHRWILPILQWAIPAVYSIPILLFSHASFEGPGHLEVVASPGEIKNAASLSAIFVTITFILTSMCYGAVLKFLIKNRSCSSAAMQKERRLYIQMLGLFVGFILFLIFNIVQFVFALHYQDGPIYSMRRLFPMISCFFSYVNAWMILILNDDLRRQILCLVSCQSKHRSRHPARTRTIFGIKLLSKMCMRHEPSCPTISVESKIGRHIDKVTSF